ncbi:hypothetical protein [Phyllobacterium zundukense]|uniref:Uncharacterized protein n=1 Tax=Phyllobacterium zundukense TaxID=1867719 RepID=A0ACD4CX65_9HYPH|nr:hypothetical protein [Phyllobacterium zundukense]UXN58175.1 hypothetical protein N8E88_04965 [Phyllobacterium zundukense]
MDFRTVAKNAASAQRMRNKLLKTGISFNGYPLWTEAEVSVLRQFHPNYSEVSRRLPQRTRAAIKRKCADLRIVKDGPRRWSGEEYVQLRKSYATSPISQVMKLFHDRTSVGLRSVLYRRRILKKSVPYKLCGNLIADSIRQRCFDLNYTIRDLDIMAGTNQYFKDIWRSHKNIDLSKLARAAKLLGGRITVKWPNE